MLCTCRRPSNGSTNFTNCNGRTQMPEVSRTLLRPEFTGDPLGVASWCIWCSQSWSSHNDKLYRIFTSLSNIHRIVCIVPRFAHHDIYFVFPWRCSIDGEHHSVSTFVRHFADSCFTLCSAAAQWLSSSRKGDLLAFKPHCIVFHRAILFCFPYWH